MGFIESFQRSYKKVQYEEFKKRQNEAEVPVKPINVTLFISIIIFFSVWAITGGILNSIFSILGLYHFEVTRKIFYFIYNISSLGLGFYSAYLFYNRIKGKKSKTTKSNPGVLQTVSNEPKFIFKTTDLNVPKIVLTNTYRSVLIVGGPGAGKSYSLIEPIIIQSIQQEFCGLLYDYKFPSLAVVVDKAQQLYPSSVKFYYVNFEDFTKSHRVNPLLPELMPTISYADEFARCILSNLKPESIQKSDFWTDSAQSYLTAAIWFLREEYPQYCTLPHVMNLINEPTSEVVDMLSTNMETRGIVASLRESIQRKAEGQTAGVVSTLQTALRKVNTKEICWVLSGDDFDLNINNPQAPKFVTLGNSATLPGVYSPVIALITTVALRHMNQQNKHKSAVILDEAPTLFIPNFEQLPATSRSNKLAIVFGAQDIAQIETMYGKTKKDAIVASLNSQFYGNVRTKEAARYIVDLWGEHYVKQVSRSMSSSNSDSGGSVSDSTSVSEQRRSRVENQEVLDLNRGEFFMQLVESNVTSYKAQIIAVPLETLPGLNPFSNVSQQDIRDNFARIQSEVRSILDKYSKGSGPSLPPGKPMSDDEF